MRPSRETIIEQFRACASKLGRTPGRELFCKLTGFKPGHIQYYWATLGELAEAAGLAPNQLNTATPLEQLFESYAQICLDVKRIPSQAQVNIVSRKLFSKSLRSVYATRFGTFSVFNERFREWLSTAPEEFVSILAFPGWRTASPGSKKSSPIPELAFHPFLPASLQYLDVLARGQKPWEHFDENINTVFERRSADAFRCLGFEVRQLGQGHGRSADFLAIASQERFAIILDAKVRGNGYILGVEDRKFLEYARTHAAQIQQLGIDKIYFAVVGSSFRESDLEKLTKYLADSPLRSVSMIAAKALIRITEESIAERYKFRLSSIEQLLFGNKIITD